MLLNKEQQQTPFSSSLFDDIAKRTQNLDLNKAHGHDNIRIRMLKISGSSIYKPAEMIFKQCIETGVFPSEWKKANIVPIHKNRDKQNGNKSQNGISGNLLDLLEDFLKERKQHVVLNGQVSA